MTEQRNDRYLLDPLTVRRPPSPSTIFTVIALRPQVEQWKTDDRRRSTRPPTCTC